MARPRLFSDPADLSRIIEDYFDRCAQEKKPLTMAGLAAELGVSRRTLLRYRDRSEFNDLLEAAKTRVEASVEERLLNGSASGPKFNLTNNFWGWGDKGLEADRPGGNLEQRMARARARAGLAAEVAGDSAGEGNGQA